MKKTTKLVAAALGVLLVAALFVGAGAAAGSVNITEPQSKYFEWTAGIPIPDNTYIEGTTESPIMLINIYDSDGTEISREDIGISITPKGPTNDPSLFKYLVSGTPNPDFVGTGYLIKIQAGGPNEDEVTFTINPLEPKVELDVDDHYHIGDDVQIEVTGLSGGESSDMVYKLANAAGKNTFTFGNGAVSLDDRDNISVKYDAATNVATITVKEGCTQTNPIIFRNAKAAHTAYTAQDGAAVLTWFDETQKSTSASATVLPKVELLGVTGEKTIAFGETVTLVVKGSDEDTYVLKPEHGLKPKETSFSGSKNVELEGYEVSDVQPVTLYLKSGSTSTGIVSTDTKIRVIECTFESSVPRGQKVDVGDSFTVTMKGKGSSYKVGYDEKVLSAPAGANGSVPITPGVPLEFTVKTVPSTHTTTLTLNDDASQSVDINIKETITAPAQVDIGDYITVAVKGIPKTEVTVASSNGRIARVTETSEVFKDITLDEAGEGSVTFETGFSGCNVGNVNFSLYISDSRQSVAAASSSVVETVEIPDTVKVGEEFDITLHVVEGAKYAILDDWGFYLPPQTNVSREKITTSSGTVYESANVITAPSSTVTLKAVASNEGQTGISLYKGENSFFTTNFALLSVTDLTIKGEGSTPAIQTVMAYTVVPGLEAGMYHLVNDHGIPTSTYINAVRSGKDVYFALPLLGEEGIYENDKGAVYRVIFPTIDLDAKVNYEGFVYDLSGNVIVKEAPYNIDLDILIPTVEGQDISAADVKFEVVDKDGAATLVKATQKNGTYVIDNNEFKNFVAGDYTLVPYYKDNVLVSGAPAGLEYGEAIPFTLIRSTDSDVVLSAEEVVAGTKLVATVTGLPGHEYMISVPLKSMDILEQKGIDDIYSTNDRAFALFAMGASGIFDVTLKATAEDDEATITVTDQDDEDAKEAEATLKILDAVIYAETDKEAYTIGEDIKVSGTNTGDNVYFYIEGTNVPFRQIYNNSGKPLSASSEEWDVTLTNSMLIASYNVGHALDAGTYTLYVSSREDGEVKDDVTGDACVTLPLTLKQSFITLTSAPEVVAQGSKIEITGTANAAKSVMWYLFGTNYFSTGYQKVKDDEFTITIDKTYTNSDNMAAGQYFLVVQHPMYDGYYSIAPDNMDSAEHQQHMNDGHADKILKYDTGIYEYKSGSMVRIDGYLATEIFGIDVRQTNNAAQALCDALDSQNFDDMYAKASFIVGAPSSIVNPIPTKIAQGEKLTLSGTTTGHVGDIVSVEFLATAFAAIPKEAVGTAAFVTVTTKVQDDGTWEIVFDTSNLNCDDYNVSVAVGSLGPITSKITVTDGPVTPTVQPTQQPTVQPTQQPTAVPTTAAPTQTPKTPGFGILAALAGLGAVAVLLLRRQ